METPITVSKKDREDLGEHGAFAEAVKKLEDCYEALLKEKPGATFILGIQDIEEVMG